jgi:hypothetical protein
MQLDAAIVGELHARRFAAGGGGDLDIVRDAETALPAARFGLLAPLREVRVMRALEAFFQQPRIIARVERNTPPVLVRQLFGRDQIAPAQFDAVDADFRGCDVH